jgi:hypothetical protein
MSNDVTLRSPQWHDLALRRMLLADWFAALAIEAGIDLGQHGRSGDAFTLGSPNDFHVRAEFIDSEPFLRFVPSDSTHDALVHQVVTEAVARVQRFELGGNVWYSTELHEESFSIASPAFMGRFMQRLGNQIRIAGWRRLGSVVLLEFTEEVPDGEEAKPMLFAPKAVIKAHLAVPGPRAGHFTSHIAHSALEAVSAICTLALGRPVRLPPTVFPTETEQIAALDGQRTDEKILTLARKTVPLDVFGWAAQPGGHQVFEKLRSALLTFDAAVKQEHDAVAAILYVVAAECLTPPPTPWRKEKLTKRFREFYDELMPDALDEIVSHGNFEEALGVRRGKRTPRALRRETLDRIYAFRSGQLHEGLDPSYRGFLGETGSGMRRALLSDFAEGAILRFIRAPRSSLIGDPRLEATSE